MKLTNGTVTFSRIAKIDDYGVNKKAEVALSLEFTEGEDPSAQLDVAAALAHKQVEKMLGVNARVASVAASPKPVEPAAAPSVPMPAPEPAPSVPPVEKPEEPVTDKELHAAATRKNEAIKNPIAIRKLVADYNPDPAKPFTMHQIPQDKRKEFLAKLDKLAPVAG